MNECTVPSGPRGRILATRSGNLLREGIMVDQQVNNGNTSGVIYALLVVIVVLIIGAVLYFGGIVGNRGGGSKDINVKIEAPATGSGSGK